MTGTPTDPTITPRALSTILIGSLTIISLLLFGPQALASHGSHGSATGTGEEESISTGNHVGPGPPPFCLEVTDSRYRVDMDGTFYADDNTNMAEYNGEATLYWETTELYYIGPDGTYTDATSMDGCSGAAGTIDSTVWVEEVDPLTGYIKECESTDAQYRRDLSVITLTWEGDCEVKDDTGSPVVNTGVVDHSFTGSLDMNGNITNGVWVYTD